MRQEEPIVELDEIVFKIKERKPIYDGEFKIGIEKIPFELSVPYRESINKVAVALPTKLTGELGGHEDWYSDSPSQKQPWNSMTPDIIKEMTRNYIELHFVEFRSKGFLIRNEKTIGIKIDNIDTRLFVASRFLDKHAPLNAFSLNGDIYYLPHS